MGYRCTVSPGNASLRRAVRSGRPRWKGRRPGWQIGQAKNAVRMYYYQYRGVGEGDFPAAGGVLFREETRRLLEACPATPRFPRTLGQA